MNAANSLDEETSLLSSALNRLINVLKAQSGSLFLYNEQENQLVLSAYYNAKGFVLTDIRKQLSEGVAGCAIKSRKPILVQDIDKDPRFRCSGFKHYHGKSFISIPLFTDDHLVGLINITDKVSGEPFSEADLLTIDRELDAILNQVLEHPAVSKKEEALVTKLLQDAGDKFLNITGKHPRMLKIFSLIEAVANTRATVLINGESGTGKRLIAHAIHKCNPQEAKKPFVEVSCGALTETLLDSELFGHVKGAFTGAFKDRIGRFELANKGTIFLDEIDSFTPAMQVKLLRVLQDGEFERVGDSKTIKVDIRIIAATNQNLQDLIAQGKFRKDLYYRLNIIHIELPPLRDRVSDIPLLTNDLVRKHAKQLGKPVKAASEAVLECFKQYPWPGNIRELENVIERAAILAKGPMLDIHDLPDHLAQGRGQSPKGDSPLSSDDLRSAVKDSEQKKILEALNSCQGSRAKAAALLGIDRTTLYKKMVSFGMIKAKKPRAKELAPAA